MKRLSRSIWGLILTVILLLNSMGAAFASEDGNFKLTIIHTNDMHGYPEAIPYAKGLVNELKSNGEPVLLIDAGDAFASTSFSDYKDASHMVTAMNKAGYDLFTVGNHEQMMSLEAYGKAAQMSEFPHLGANTNDEFKAAGNVRDYVIKEIGGVKIAFIGLSTGNYTELNGNDAVQCAENAKAAAEAEGATVFIGVFHLGITDTDLSLRSTYIAENCGWLTAIIDAHCHTPYAQTVNGVYMVETGEYSNNIGVLELTFKDGKAVEITSDRIAVRGNEANCGITPDAEITTYIAEVEAQLAYLKAVVGTFPVALDGERTTVRAKEALLGNIATDAMREYTGADIAFIPGPFIRSSIAAGDMTMEALQGLFLHQETAVVYFELSGAEILDFIENTCLDGVPEVSSNFRQLSGLIIRYDETKPVGSRIVTITLADGTPLDPQKTYQLVGTDMDRKNIFGDDWEEKGLTFKEDDVTLNNMLMNYVNSGKVVAWETDGRISSVNDSGLSE
ncbi:MAG: bifunctional metallophosphatase/5'-nucleotidase [Lachnospiraceae bacterium]